MRDLGTKEVAGARWGRGGVGWGGTHPSLTLTHTDEHHTRAGWASALSGPSVGGWPHLGPLHSSTLESEQINEWAT